MTYARSCLVASRLLIAAVCGAGIGGFFAFASAQDRPPGALDLDCSRHCAANGYDAEFCGQVCWIPGPEIAANGEPIDWICMTDCRERGGNHKDCRLACKRR
jgi:hypothetical protein